MCQFCIWYSFSLSWQLKVCPLPASYTLLYCTTTWHQSGLGRDFVDKNCKVGYKARRTSFYGVAPVKDDGQRKGDRTLLKLIKSYFNGLNFPFFQDGSPPKVISSLSPLGSFHPSQGSHLPAVVVKVVNFLKKEQQV